MSSELLHYEDVKFRREGREILKGINWHVEEGLTKFLQQDYYAYLVMNLANMHGLKSRPD